MNRMAFLLVGPAVLLGACATASALDARPLDSGTSMEFAAPSSRVVTAAKETLMALGLAETGVREQSGSTVLAFQKSITAFSWGELGRLVVTPGAANAARVFVDTEKVSQMQITGTSESEFARDIFAGISQRLAK